MDHPLDSTKKTPPVLDKLALKYAGKLLLRDEINLNDTTLQKLLSKNYFKTTSSMKKKGFRFQCVRCGNMKKSLLAIIPCILCKKDHLYCRKCIDMGRVLECEPLYIWTGESPKWSKIKNPYTWDGKLTVTQRFAANRIVQAIIKGEKELLIWSVTGSGKTEMLFPGISKALVLGYRICIATPRSDVVRELLPRLQRAFATIPIQGLYGGSENKDASSQLVIATTHQLIRFYEAFDVIIIDEIDAFPYHSDPSLPYVTKRALKKERTMVYLTATPRETHRIQVERKKLPHVFVPTRFHGHPLPIPQMMICSLKKELKNDEPPKTLLQWLKNRENKQRQLLLFVPTIQMAKKMKKNIAHKLIVENIITTHDALLAVHSKDSDREEKIKKFRHKEIYALLTTTILERGVTFPSIDVAVIDAGHDVFDEAALVQIAGRAGRSIEDPTGEVVFIHDGKTEAMVEAIRSIKMMNQRGGFLT